MPYPLPHAPSLASWLSGPVYDDAFATRCRLEQDALRPGFVPRRCRYRDRPKQLGIFSRVSLASPPFVASFSVVAVVVVAVSGACVVAVLGAVATGAVVCVFAAYRVWVSTFSRVLLASPCSSCADCSSWTFMLPDCGAPCIMFLTIPGTAPSCDADNARVLTSCTIVGA